MKLLGTLLLAFSGASSVVSAASLNSYVSSESKAAYNGLMANIGTAGSKSAPALDGVVVAAPTDDPPYRYDLACHSRAWCSKTYGRVLVPSDIPGFATRLW